MKDLLIGLTTVLLTCLVGALTLYALWTFWSMVAPFILSRSL